MERKRVSNPRCYRHKCQANGNREQQIPEEICPECGTRGEFFGWFQGMWNRIGKKSRLLGFPCTGPQMTFLPTMTRSCGRCEGEGILAGDDFDYQCPECEGLGGFPKYDEPTMRKVRRWALARHGRTVKERQAVALTGKPQTSVIPENPVIDRNPHTFVKAMMYLKAYSIKYGARNSQIGERMLKCDAYGWDVFMELLEIWHQLKKGVAVSEQMILLKSSERKDAVTLLILVPPASDQKQGIQVDRQKIQRRIGKSHENRWWRFVVHAQPTENGWVPITNRLSREHARDWILWLLYEWKFHKFPGD